MSITSTKPTSRRGYVSKEEVADYTGAVVGTITDAIIQKAEEIIDGIVGYHEKFMPNVVEGKVSVATANTLTLEDTHQNTNQNDYYVLCEVEIIGGTGAGQRRKITGSTLAGVLTVDTNWTTQIDSTSIYKIYQLGKFPRQQDIYFDSRNTPNTYYKTIPDAIKRAVCAEYEYILEMGDSFFAGGGDSVISERIGDYSYQNADGDVSEDDLVSNKVKLLLTGYIKRTGKIIV